MAKKMFFISLSEDFPSTTANILADLLLYWKGIPHLRSETLEYSGPFLDLQAFPVEEGLPPRRVFVPARYVLTIVERSEGNHPPGYVVGNK